MGQGVPLLTNGLFTNKGSFDSGALVGQVAFGSLPNNMNEASAAFGLSSTARKLGPMGPVGGHFFEALGGKSMLGDGSDDN